MFVVLWFRRRTSVVLLSNLFLNLAFGTAEAQRLNRLDLR